jgi:paraquat-inducible protein B
MHANYGRVGFAVVAAAVAIVGTLIYLGGAGGDKDVVYAEMYYDNPVTGLSVGSDVNLRGVKVGEVREISFIGSEYDDASGRDASKIYILMSFSAKKMRKGDDMDAEENLRRLVAKGLRATVTSSGVTGLSKVELNFPRTAVSDQQISWRPRHVCIPPAPSMLESFSDAVAKFMNQLNRMDFVAAWSNISTVAESAARIAANVDDLVDNGKSGIESIVRDMEGAATEVKELATSLRENPSLLLRSADAEPLPETRP